MNLKLSKKDVKANRGITLIALVITIIVLLILAGVSLTLIVGENGIISKAQNAKILTDEAKVKEDLAIAWASAISDYYLDTSDKKLSDYLEKENLNRYLPGFLIENPVKKDNGYRLKYNNDAKIYTVFINDDKNI